MDIDLAGLDLNLLDEVPDKPEPETTEIGNVFEIVVACESEQQQQEVLLLQVLNLLVLILSHQVDQR